MPYRNTDLDLVCDRDLRDLVVALETHGLFALHVMRGDDTLWYARLETEVQYDDADSNIAAMLVAVESLTDEQCTIWWTCARREFNIGYESDSAPHAGSHVLSPEVLTRVVASGASIGFTLYGLPDATGP